jgi:hypothetical protein
MELKRRGTFPLCVDLPTERDAMEVAKRIAEKLAEASGRPGRMVTVTDEHDTIIAKVPIPSKS